MPARMPYPLLLRRPSADAANAIVANVNSIATSLAVRRRQRQVHETGQGGSQGNERADRQDRRQAIPHGLETDIPIMAGSPFPQDDISNGRRCDEYHALPDNEPGTRWSSDMQPGKIGAG